MSKDAAFYQVFKIEKYLNGRLTRGDNKPVEVSHSDFCVIVLVPGCKSASADADIQWPFLLFFKTGRDEGNVFSVL